jgi:hypothetical protein
MTTDDTPDRPLPERVYRTVTPPYRSRPDREMHTVGLLLFAGLIVLLLPLGPFLLVAWLFAKVAGRARRES